MPAKFEIMAMPPENTNSVLMTVGNDAVIFDAWGRADDWQRLLGERGLSLRAVYSTHGHGDHISAAPHLAARYDVPWYLNTADTALIEWSRDLLAYFGLPVIDGSVAPTNLPYGTFEILPGAWADVIAAPGHSAGGVAFYFPDSGILIIGDTLFANGVGRCDLPGGDDRALATTISRICAMNLADETFVVPGHGYAVTWGEMRRTNPYVRDAYGCGCECGCGGHHCESNQACACDHDCACHHK